MASTPTLKKALSQRQLTMIAIGGVIGAGLFVGSGVVIKDTGPCAFITYALAGVLIIMVMRMLAEMAVANPSTGSFADYARNALGNWAGFSVGWLYWYFWVIVVGFEAIAGAKIIQYWVDIPLWLSALVLMILMTGDQPVLGVVVRRVRVLVRRHQGGRDRGVHRARVAVRARLVAGQDRWTSPTCGATAGSSRRVMAVTVGVVTVIFSMVGAEIATIAAAESAIRRGRWRKPPTR